MPELRVDVLQEELEAATGDVERCGGGGAGTRLHQVAPTQQIQHGFARRARLVAADHVVEDGLPFCARVVVEKGDVDGVLILVSHGTPNERWLPPPVSALRMPSVYTALSSSICFALAGLSWTIERRASLATATSNSLRASFLSRRGSRRRRGAHAERACA